MYRERELMSISDELKIFIDNLIEENENKRLQIIEKRKNCLNEISKKEAFISTISQTSNESSRLFSPNSKDHIDEDYYSELNNLKELITDMEVEEDKLNQAKRHLVEIKNIIVEQKPPLFNIGSNILEIQEQDRKRIARDLHDSTVQNLTSLIHKSELCQKLIDTDPVRTKLELYTMSGKIKSIINEIREIIYNLKPMSLDDLGLIATIERFTNQLMLNHDIKITLTHNKERRDIIPVVKLSLFRIIQEACNNVIKHAEAKCIDIEIRYANKQLMASISDDGKGFEIEKQTDCVTADYTGYGLQIMKERVYLLGGIMKIQSRANKGTNVTITIPIAKSEGDK